MIVWEEVVNRYVMSIFGKEALSVFERRTPVSHVLEGKSLAYIPHWYYPHFDTPTRILCPQRGKRKSKGKTGKKPNRSPHLSFSFFSRGKFTHASKERKRRKRRKKRGGGRGGQRTYPTHGWPALGFPFTCHASFDRSMFKEREREKSKKKEKRRTKRDEEYLDIPQPRGSDTTNLF